jgi:hypothetical protein
VAKSINFPFLGISKPLSGTFVGFWAVAQELFFQTKAKKSRFLQTIAIFGIVLALVHK